MAYYDPVFAEIRGVAKKDVLQKAKPLALTRKKRSITFHENNHENPDNHDENQNTQHASNIKSSPGTTHTYHNTSSVG
jgi:ribosomal protein S10